MGHEKERSLVLETADRSPARVDRRLISDASNRSRRARRCTTCVRKVVLNAETAEPTVAVVIATCNRPELLAARALPAIAQQTHGPDHVIVIDDSNPEVRPTNRQNVESTHIASARVTYLQNRRTAGASGCWNTGLEFLYENLSKPSDTFVAILDDDDSWASVYLDHCIQCVQKYSLDMVAADIHRIENSAQKPILTAAPDVFDEEDFFTHNPGIQGSNMFVRLSLLLEAGGFDEELESTTDRDLCIRLADLGAIRYRRVAVPLVQHFADDERKRLSTPGTGPKLRGLASFWKKHAGRMTVTQQYAYWERARKLFCWQNDSLPPVSDSQEQALTPLVVGIVASNGQSNEAKRTTNELLKVINDGFTSLDIVIMEDGSHNGFERSIEDLAVLVRECGAGCYVCHFEECKEAEEDGAFNESMGNQNPDGTKTNARKILEACVSHIAAARNAPNAWIVAGADTSAERRQPSHFAGITDVVFEKLSALGAQPVNSQLALSANNGQAGETIARCIHRERLATARHRIRYKLGIDSLKLLGYGSEGVVFHDQHTVYKCIDHWKTRTPKSQLRFLRGNVGKWKDLAGLYELRSLHEEESWSVITYDYEQSKPYAGGREDELVQLVESCHRAGIVCNNIHPKNLVVTANGVKLIDYGADIRRMTETGLEHMARRAFIACHYSQRHDLAALLRLVLREPELPELRGFARFRKKLDAFHTSAPKCRNVPERPNDYNRAREPFTLYAGIVSSEPAMVGSILREFGELNSVSTYARIIPVVLDNGQSKNTMKRLIKKLRRSGIDLAYISRDAQRRDAAGGAFGRVYGTIPSKSVGIAQGRTMIQRYVGEFLRQDESAFGCVFDDDMSVDRRVETYLRWLPAFRQNGVDAVIGQYEGASPNPALNGIRVQLLDLFHNYVWLRSLDSASPLPDRSSENYELRKKYPDYYYDLSRKHTAHVEMPHWLEPAFQGESVRQAYERLLFRSASILNGAPLTRPLVSEIASNPVSEAVDSVNRGGITFFLNHRPLTEVPNTSVKLHGREARRSDMIWAVIGRYYRNATIKKVGFPIFHRGRFAAKPTLDLEKVTEEIVGSALYAGLTEFLAGNAQHKLDFTKHDRDQTCRLIKSHLNRRLQLVELSFYRIRGLTRALQNVSRRGEFHELLGYLENWFSSDRFAAIRDRSRTVTRHDFDQFIASLRQRADDYAQGRLRIDLLQKQLRGRS